MAVEIASIYPLGVPGLDKALTETDLAVSRIAYNDLPYISNQKSPVERSLKLVWEAIALIARHSMGKNFRPHVAHRHDLIDNGTVRFETEAEIEGTLYTVTKPTNISGVDSSNMHPTCFKVIGNDLVPFEFAEGPTPLDASKIPTEFVREWVDFLNMHGLTNLLTLDFGSFGKGDGQTTEIEVQLQDTSVTITVPIAACIRDSATNVPTSWTVSLTRARDPGARDSSPAQPPPGTHWNESTKPDGTKTHKVHVDSLSGSSSIRELVEALATLSVIQAFQFRA